MIADESPVPPSALLQLVSLVLMLLGAPARAWVRFVRWSDEKLALIERTLRIIHARGLRLRYEGESAATAEKRLAMIEWFFANPTKAMRHVGRLQRAGYRMLFRPGKALQHASPAAAPISDACVENLVEVECARDDSS